MRLFFYLDVGIIDLLVQSFRDTRRLSYYFRPLVWAVIILIGIALQSAIAQESLFYSQCRQFLPNADEFASDCLHNARPFERTFYPGGVGQGQLESFSVYFAPITTPSRFLFGCVLNFRHQLLYVGMYYAHSLFDMSKLNQYPIDFIDFDANVGLDVDGSQLTLIAVRQFSTTKAQSFLGGYFKNCEPTDIEFFNGSPPKTQYGVHYYIHDNIVDEYGNDGGYTGRINVQNYNGVHEKSLIFAGHFHVMIDEDGVLLIEKQVEDHDTIQLGFLKIKRFNNCIYQKSDMRSVGNIYYELCRKNRSK